VKKPSERLQTVLMLAKLREQQAAEQLASAIRAAQQQQQQVEQLESFQREYNSQFAVAASAGASAQQLKNHQTFYGKLDSALSSQQSQLDAGSTQLDRAREHWQFHYAKQKNMPELVAKTRQLEIQIEEKNAQREQDDRKLQKPIA
jgi:flagellar FliJ protein